MARNWSVPPPTPVWMMNDPDDSAASVPICSAISTGCHKGTRNKQPTGRSVHSARMRPSIGTFCTYPAGPVAWWSPKVKLSRPARFAAWAWLRTSSGPSRWPRGPLVLNAVPMDIPTRIIPTSPSRSCAFRDDENRLRSRHQRGACQCLNASITAAKSGHGSPSSMTVVRRDSAAGPHWAGMPT